MAELTINQLIKIALASAVMIIIILGIYAGVRYSIIPYFSGIGFEEPRVDINTQFGQELIQDRNLIGRVDNEGFFIYENQKTDLRFKDGKILLSESFLGINWLKPDTKSGIVGNDGRLEVKEITQYYSVLNGAYKYGNEIYKVGGEDE